MDAVPVPHLCRVAEDFEGEEEGELSIKEGTEVIVVQCDDDGWWTVVVKNNAGIFPSSYLEPISHISLPSSAKMTADVPDMNLKRGQTVTIQEITPDGWMVESGNNLGFCNWNVLEVIKDGPKQIDPDFEIPNLENKNTLFNIPPTKVDVVNEPEPIKINNVKSPPANQQQANARGSQRVQMSRGGPPQAGTGPNQRGGAGGQRGGPATNQRGGPNQGANRGGAGGNVGQKQPGVNNGGAPPKAAGEQKKTIGLPASLSGQPNNNSNNSNNNRLRNDRASTYKRPVSIFGTDYLEKEMARQSTINPYALPNKSTQFEQEGRFEWHVLADIPTPPQFSGAEKSYVTTQPSWIDWECKERSAFFDI